MSWPGWIDELKQRYLADEASVFVIDGVVDDEPARTLVQFLKQTREVVGVLRPAPPPARLEFADFIDRTKFERLVKAADVLAGGALAVSESDPSGALARIWRAMTTSGVDQGWIVTDTERLVPAPRKRVDPIPGAPELFAWPTHPTLRRSNNVLVFLTNDAANVRPELLEGAALISIADRVWSEPSTADTAELLDTVEAAAPASQAAAPGLEAAAPGLEAAAPGLEAAPPAPTADPLRADLEAALSRALATHPAEHRPARLPVMDAVAQVVAARRPDRWGALTFALDAEGAPAVEGPGAEAFLEAWRGDIALDASAGMLLRAAAQPASEQGPPPLDATAVGALVRRVGRLL
jgi:hypothetical protein